MRSGAVAILLFLRTVSVLGQKTPLPLLTPEDERLLAHASDLQKAGRNDEALAAVDQFVGSLEKRITATDFRLALVYSRVATAIWRMDLAAADKYYDKALAMAKSSLPANNQKLLFPFFTTYAWCKLREDQYSRAKELLDEAADVALPDLLSTTFHMAADFRQAGDHVRSEWVFRYLLKQLEPVADTQHEIVAGIYNQLGVLLGARGDVEEAKKLYQTAITDAEKAFGPTSPKMQPFLYNLGQLHEKHGEYAEAEKLYQRALSNSELNPQDQDGLASNLSNLGVLYMKLDKRKEARNLIERAVKIRRPIRQDTGLAVLLTNLASACAAVGEDELAESHYKEALDISMKYADTDRTAMTVMAELGSFYLERNRKPAADELLSRAAAMNETGLTALDPDRADWFTTVATTYLTHGDCNLSLSYLQRGDSVWERNLALLMTAGTQEQRQQYLSQSDVERHVAVSIHNHCFPSRDDVAQFAYESVLQHKARGVDAFADQLGAMRLRGTPEEKELLRKYADAATELSTNKAGGTQDPTTKVRSLETEISVRSAEFGSLRNRPSFEALRQAIPTGHVLIEFFAQVDVKPGSEEMTNRYMAYVALRARSVPTLIDLGAVNQIDSAARDWRKALADPSRKDVDTLGSRLYGIVFAPLLPQLRGAQKLIIAPDGQLNLLPFGALVGTDGEHLLEKYDITYIGSGRDLLRTTQKNNNSSVIVFADPVYDLERQQIDSDAAFRSIPAAVADLSNKPGPIAAEFKGRHISRLPSTADEAKAVRDVIPGAEVKVRENATELAVKTIRRPLVLHIATHGFFIGASKGDKQPNPLLRTGLLLTGVTQGQSGTGQDGVLTAMEMSTMDLTGTELVVLSACDTGVGDVHVGDGVYGLRRALLLAGASSQLISLWAVEDASTKDLIENFYRGLKDGLDRSEALRVAQRKLAGSAGHEHPFFWAAFVLSGSRGPLPLDMTGKKQ